MKICADEHVSPEIVRVVREIALNPSWELSHVFDAGQGGADDVPWITQFARNGGKAILTADADFHKRPHQVMAVCNTGLIVVHLHPRWANSRRTMQTSHILFWWEAIEGTLKLAKPRQCWKVPFSFPEQKRELTQTGLDYEEARKKLKRQEQRASRSV